MCKHVEEVQSKVAEHAAKLMSLYHPLEEYDYKNYHLKKLLSETDMMLVMRNQHLTQTYVVAFNNFVFNHGNEIGLLQESMI